MLFKHFGFSSKNISFGTKKTYKNPTFIYEKLQKYFNET